MTEPKERPGRHNWAQSFSPSWRRAGLMGLQSSSLPQSIGPIPNICASSAARHAELEADVFSISASAFNPDAKPFDCCSVIDSAT